MRWFNIQPKRSEVEEKALQTALSIYNSDPKKYKDTMFCPFCGQPLVKSGELRRMETLSEHISCVRPTEKEVYVCPSKYYEGYPGCKYGAFHHWNGDLFGENGGSYMSDFCKEIMTNAKKNDAAKELLAKVYTMGGSNALNTYNKSAEKAIYREGLPREIRLWPWLTFNLIQLRFEFSYSADYFGRVTKTWINLGFLKKDDSGTFCLIGNNPIHTWEYLYKKFKRRVNLARKQKDLDTKMKLLLEAYAKSNNDSWEYKVFHWCIVKLHPIESKKVLEHYHISSFFDDWDTDKFLQNKSLY